MRISGGKAKGHVLKIPVVSDLRPSQEMIRQATFNILGEKVKNTDVADLFAGTGALGLEALSRGARHADFIEIEPRIARTIQENLNHTFLTGKANVRIRDAKIFLRETFPKSYDLIFLDPPYRLDINYLLPLLANILKEDGIAVYFHPKTKKFGNIPKLRLCETRIYGDTGVTFFKRSNSSSL